jgi:hypothetical protein
VQPSPSAPVAAASVAEAAPVPEAPITSPYHAHPAAPLETRVEQAHYPALLPTRDVPLRPPVLQEPPTAPLPVVQTPAANVEALPVSASVTPPAPPPQPPEEPLLAALRCYLNRRPAEALTLLARYDKLNQEMLLALLPLAAGLTEANLEKARPDHRAAVLAQLESLEEPLRARAPLVLDKICFCKSITGFGVYEPLPECTPVFRPGEWPEVYIEVRNFTCTPQGNRYVTRLAGTMRVLDMNRKEWWRDEMADRPDRRQSRQHDLFISWPFNVPSLPPGLYTLWIQVTDAPTGRTMHKSLDFRVTTLPRPRSS